jgi:hypothetical protein
VKTQFNIVAYSTQFSHLEKHLKPLYRFLNSSRCNWRRFLLLLGCGLIQTKVNSLTKEERVKVLIFDDSLFSRTRSKAVELLANVHDHTTGKYIRGFRMLTLGWSDGNTFVPLCFSLLSSHKKSSRYVEMNDGIDKRTAEYQRRKEAVKKSSETLQGLLKQALHAGVQASYVLFDSWFNFPLTILNVLEQGVHVICMLRAIPRVYYVHDEQKLNLNALYRAVRKKRGKAKMLASVIITLGTDEQGKEVLILTEEKFQEIFDKFLSSLPKYIKGLLGVSVYES